MSVRVLVIVAVLAMVIPQVASGEILLPPNGSTWQIMASAPVGETFTAESAGAIVGLYVRDGNQSSGPSDYSIQVDLWEGAGASGTHLYQTAFNDLVYGFAGFVEVDISSVYLTVGQVYTVTLWNDNPRWGIAGSDSAYSDGAPVFGGIAYPGSSDFAFHMLETEGAVPEPSTMLLFLSMIPACLAMLRWRRR